MAEADPWAFGWTAIAGIATSLLAGLTAWLAWSTRALARETDQDVRAGWRPILTPEDDPTVEVRVVGDRFEVRLDLGLDNTGQGPALNCELTALRPRSAAGITWAARRVSSIAAGRSGSLLVEGMATPIPEHPNPDIRSVFIATYEDVARNQYRSIFVLAAGKEGGQLAMQDIEVEDLGKKARYRGLPR